jgi:hypothetical protein
MAMPLTPETGLFPGTEVEPFIGAPDLERLGAVVLGEFKEFTGLARAVVDQAVSVVYVFETKPFDPVKDEMKPHIIAKVTKASPLWRCVSGVELVVQFRQAFWDVFDVDQRRAVLHHEFTHVEVETAKDGAVKLSLREHDVEDFTQTMRKFGPIIPGRAAFVKAFLDWQHEQERPEPTKLRRVETAAGPQTVAGDGRILSDETDVRPTGEVNVDELRGEAERSVDPDDLSDLPF